MAHYHPLYPGDAGAFDVRWRHFRPQLSLEQGPGPGISSVYSEALNLGVPIQVRIYFSRELCFFVIRGVHYIDMYRRKSSSAIYIFLQGPLASADSPQPSTAPHYKYLVRIINPGQKSKYITKIWHNVNEQFQHAKQMKKQMIDDFEDRLPQLSDLECGYLFKGAKRWIEDDQDLNAMYKAFNCGDEITIWCEGRLPEQHSAEPPARGGRKRKAQESEDMPSTKKSDLIDQTAHDLYEKHGERLTMPQLRLWARMVVNKQYTSLDVPPPYPPFKDQISKTPGKRDSLSDALTSAATAVVGLLKGNGTSDSPSSSTLSPCKWARVFVASI